MSRTALYRHYDAAGQLLYVGISCDLESRDRAHTAQSHWHGDVHRTATEWCLSREHARDLERVAIVHERPLHNVVHAPFAPKTPDGWEAAPINGHAGAFLASYLNACNSSQRAFASVAGISRSFLSEIIAGKKTPGLMLATRIAAVTAGAVPVTVWRGCEVAQ